MPRHNFSEKTKRLALERSQGRCEAQGAVYGLNPGTRCATSIAAGNYDVDHYPLPAHVEGSNTLDNAVACCKSCHSFKTRTWDVPFEAKLKRSLRKRGEGSKPPKAKKPIPRPANFQWPKRKMKGRPKDS